MTRNSLNNLGFGNEIYSSDINDKILLAADHLNYHRLQKYLAKNPLHRRMVRSFPKMLGIKRETLDRALCICMDSRISVNLEQPASSIRSMCANILIQAGAVINSEHTYLGPSSLIRALHRHDIVWANMVLLAHGDVNGTYGTRTALHWCALCLPNDIDVLLKYGPKLDEVDETGNTVLMILAFKLHFNEMKSMLHAGCNVDIKNKNGKAAIHFVFQQTHYKPWAECLDLLFEYGADIDATDDNGKRPIHRAMLNYDLDSIKILLRMNCYLGDLEDFVKVRPCWYCAPILIDRFYEIRRALVLINEFDTEYEIAQILLRLGLTSKYLNCQELEKQIQSVTLQDLCRKVIRQHLGKRILENIHSLGLPQKYVPFILLDDVFMEDFPVHPGREWIKDNVQYAEITARYLAINTFNYDDIESMVNIAKGIPLD